MLGHARAAINDAIQRWSFNSDTAEYNVQHWLANNGDNRNADALEPMHVCLGLLERIIWNSFRVDSWRLSTELLYQSSGNVSELVA
jgi:hypothetical protein